MTFLNLKPSTYVLIASLIISLMLSGGNYYINAIDDVDTRLTEHLVNESPHYGTSVQIQTILDNQAKFEKSYLLHQQEDLQTRQQVIKELHNLKLVICELENINCTDLLN